MNHLERSGSFLSTLPAESFYHPSTYLLGIPYDGSTSFRPGSRFGPNAIREASFGLETYSPCFDRDLEKYPLYDLGNLPFFPSRFERSKENFSQLTASMTKRHKLLTLGGEHSISFLPIKKYLELYPNLVVVHLDAHADLRDIYLEDPHSHASIMRRVLEIMTSSKQLIQYGVRSGTREEFEWMKNNQTLFNCLDSLLKKIQSFESPVYLTLDLDFFDPAYLPGTGTPETGGESFHSFMSILKALAKKNFVGADIVELAPMIDPTGNSSCMASKVVRETLIALSEGH